MSRSPEGIQEHPPVVSTDLSSVNAARRSGRRILARETCEASCQCQEAGSSSGAFNSSERLEASRQVGEDSSGGDELPSGKGASHAGVFGILDTGPRVGEYLLSKDQVQSSSSVPSDHLSRNMVDILARFPNEIVLHILRQLPSHHSILALRQTSRRHRAMADDPSVWREFFHRNRGWRLKGDSLWIQGVLDSLEDREALLMSSQNCCTEGTKQASSPYRASDHSPDVWRLDWKELYRIRYRLAIRWGEVQSRKEQLIDCDVHTSLHRRPIASGRQNENDSSSDEELSNRRVAVESRFSLATHLEHLSPSNEGNGTVTVSPSGPKIFSPEVRTIGQHDNNIYCVKTCLPPLNFAPSSGYIVTGSKDTTIRVWSIETGSCVHILRDGHSGSILALDICPQGHLMVSASSDQRLGIWSWFGCAEAVCAAAEGRSWKPELLDRWNCHTTVMDVRLTEQYLVLGLKHGQVRCYSRQSMGEQITSRQPPNLSQLIAFERLSVVHSHICSVNDMTVKGDLAAVGYANGEMEVIHLPSGSVRHHLPKQRGVACIDYGQDILICGSSDLNIYCFRASTGALLATLSGHEGLPRSVQFDEERAVLVSVGYDGIVNVWDLTPLLPSDVLDGSALGHSRRSSPLRTPDPELDLEVRLRSLATGVSENDTNRLADIKTGMRLLPRFSSRDFHYRPRDRSAVGDEVPPARKVRLFDVALDNRRVITVGEMRSIQIREFLPQHERNWLGWELFA